MTVKRAAVRALAGLVLLLMGPVPVAGLLLGIWVDWRWALTGLVLAGVGFLLGTPFARSRDSRA